MNVPRLRAWGWLAGVTMLTCLAAPAAGQGLSGTMDRQESQQALHQFDMRQEAVRQRQETQRQLEQSQAQQLIDRQQMLRQAPIPSPIDPFGLRRRPAGAPTR